MRSPSAGAIAFGGEIRNGRRRTGGVLRIVAGDDAQQRGGVAHIAGEGAHPIERGSKGDEPIPRNAPVGGQHADHAAETGRLADGAAGIAAQRAYRHVGGNGRSRSAARSARHPFRIHRIAHRAVGGVLVGRAHGELVAVELAQQHRPGGIEPGNHSGVIGRTKALQDPGTRRGRSAPHHQHVLDAHGNAGQRRQRVSLGRHGVHARSLLERAVLGQGQVDIQLRIHGRDALVIRGSKIDGLDRPGRNVRAQPGECRRLRHEGLNGLCIASQSESSVVSCQLLVHSS